MFRCSSPSQAGGMRSGESMGYKLRCLAFRMWSRSPHPLALVMERIHKVPTRVEEKGGVFPRIPHWTLRAPVDDQVFPRINSIRSTLTRHDDCVTWVHAYIREEVFLASFT